MKKLVIANWKMNPATEDEARKLAAAVEHGLKNFSDGVETAIAAPAVFLPSLADYATRVKLAAQNTSWAEKGALTGEISPKQLQEYGVGYVILGHSERRLYLGETDSVVNAKVISAIKHRIAPVLCLGGEAGAIKNEMKTLVTKQFIRCTKNLTRQQLAKIVYVYEPTWAISTMSKSEPATGEHAADVAVHIQGLLEHRLGRKHAAGVKILYGGTVNKNNVHEYAKYPQIGGALVGAASLDADNFLEIIREFDRESIHK